MRRALLTLGLALVTVVSGVPASASAVTASAVTTTALSSAPTAVTAIAGAGTVQLAWGAPATPSGTVSDYVVQYRLTTSSTYTTVVDGVSTDLAATITGLKRGSSYYVKVAAVTESGRGTFSSPKLVKTLTGLPSGVVRPFALSQLTAIGLGWDPPATTNGGGPVIDYVVRYRVLGTTTWKTFLDGVSDAPSVVVTGLTRSRSYAFTVQAVTAFGRGAAVSLQGSTFNGIPSRVRYLGGSTYGVDHLYVSWAEAYALGSPVTDYVVQYRQLGYTTWRTHADGVSGTLTQTEITGLKRGVTYEVKVWAKSLYGSGSSSTTRLTVDNGLPGAPRFFSSPSTAVDSLTLQWAAPGASWPDYPITSYTVLMRKTGTTTWREAALEYHGATHATVPGLTRGTSYEFAVYASTVYGRGPSTRLTAVTLTGVPSAVPSIEFEPSAHRVVVKSQNPWENGSPIVDYVVRYRPVGSTTWRVFDDGVSTTPWVTVTGLSRLTAYEFSAHAVSAYGAGLASPVVRASTLSGVPSAAIVTSTGTRTSTSVTNLLRVTPDPDYPITSYEIDYRVYGGSQWTTLTLTALDPDDMITIEGLSPSTTYEVRVRAISSQGAGPYGFTQYVYTRS
ncbi:fibronectin type III domain-containing protein [Microcella sp.]|uniref:fibronectin type III domain-containing protein n=1 Tax=Microcella sp. TaxID=1913979 RepID=UPI00391DC574